MIGNIFQRRKRIVVDEMKPMLLAYNGADILCLLLDNLESNTDLIKHKVLTNLDYCNNKFNLNCSSYLLYDLTETEITHELAILLVKSIKELRQNTTKIAFIGVSSRGKKNIQRCLEDNENSLNSQYRFVTGMEPAKQWLTGEIT